MCEILLCVHDRGTSGVLAIDSHAPKNGDVITAQADGWVWGGCELGHVVAANANGNHNFFRILKLPNITIAQLSNLLSRELDVDPQHPSPYLQYRAFFVDITAVGPTAPFLPLPPYWNDDTRAQPFLTSLLTNAQFQTMVKQRTPIPF